MSSKKVTLNAKTPNKEELEKKINESIIRDTAYKRDWI